jgi:hypothetical protein
VQKSLREGGCAHEACIHGLRAKRPAKDWHFVISRDAGKQLHLYSFDLEVVDDPDWGAAGLVGHQPVGWLVQKPLAELPSIRYRVPIDTHLKVMHWGWC